MPGRTSGEDPSTETQKQKHDRRDAGLLWELLMEDRFPENLDALDRTAVHMKNVLNGAFGVLALSPLLAVGTVVVAQDTSPAPAPDNIRQMNAIAVPRRPRRISRRKIPRTAILRVTSAGPSSRKSHSPPTPNGRCKIQTNGYINLLQRCSADCGIRGCGRCEGRGCRSG